MIAVKEHQMIFFYNSSCSILFPYYCGIVAMFRKSSRSCLGRPATRPDGLSKTTPSQLWQRCQADFTVHCPLAPWPCHSWSCLCDGLVSSELLVLSLSAPWPYPSRTRGVLQAKPGLIHTDVWLSTYPQRDTIILAYTNSLARAAL